MLEKSKDPKVPSVMLCVKTTSHYRNLKIKPMHLISPNLLQSQV